MNALRLPVRSLFGLVLLAGCAGEPREAAPLPVSMWSITTPSEEARRHVAQGMLEEDLSSLPGNLAESQAANEAYRRAITIDPSFAFAYLRAAATAPSLDEYRANLERAAELGGSASATERLLIRIQQNLFQRDLEGAREAALELQRSDSTQPRAWLELARIESAMGEEEGARKSAARAVQIAPKFAAAHMWLGDSYAMRAPLDLARAEEHARKAVALVPEKSTPYDLLGDVLRAQNRLADAAAAYTRAAALDSTNALALQQRGHVNSFLGNYAQARADYDAAFERGRGNARANFRTFRAFVNLHEGNLPAAVKELERLVQEIDRMPMEDPDEMRRFALINQALIALHGGLLDDAERAIARRRDLQRKAADEVNTPEFRRTAEADIAVWEGMLATFRGNHAAAVEKAQAAMRIRQADRDPTKNRPAHSLLGLVALRQGKHAQAISHFQQGLPNDFYFNYQHALALEGAGRKEEATALFKKVADARFNSAGLLLVREDAAARLR